MAQATTLNTLNKDKSRCCVWRGTIMEGYQEKHSKQGKGCYIELSPPLLHWWEFLEIQSFSSSWYREGDTLVNVNVPYKE